MSAGITIIVTPADDDEEFENMDDEQRRSKGHEWEEFPLGSDRFLDSFFMTATKSDLSVIACDDRKIEGVRLQTRLLVRDVVVDVIPDLKGLIDKDADSTALALQKHGGGKADLARVSAALKSGTWPKTGDPAEESAAFARQLLNHAILAKEAKMGVCWEYSGDVKV